MDGTPQPPQPPAPLASMCRDRWWKTYLHALQTGIRPDSIRRNFGRALASPPCSVHCVVWMPGRGRFGGKRWTPVADLVFLRTSFSTNKMQSTANLAEVFLCCSAIVHMSAPHSETALPPRCEICGTGTVRIGKLPRIGLRPLVYVYKCAACNQITSVEPERQEATPRRRPAPTRRPRR